MARIEEKIAEIANADLRQACFGRKKKARNPVYTWLSGLVWNGEE